jgi:hypothetical protein
VWRFLKTAALRVDITCQDQPNSPARYKPDGAIHAPMMTVELQAPLWQVMIYLSLNRDPSCGQNRPQSGLVQWGKGQLLPFIRKPPNLFCGILPF